MSRHQIPAYCVRHTIFVGWDSPLQTYFAVIEDGAIPDHQNPVIFQVGQSPHEITSPEKLCASINEYASLHPNTLRRLVEDRQNSPPPSALQRAMIDLIGKKDADKPFGDILTGLNEDIAP